jgi:hypothetical protein
MNEHLRKIRKALFAGLRSNYKVRVVKDLLHGYLADATSDKRKGSDHYIFHMARRKTRLWPVFLPKSRGFSVHVSTGTESDSTPF